MKQGLGSRFNLIACGVLLAGGLAGCTADGAQQEDEVVAKHNAPEAAEANVANDWNQIFIDTLVATNTSNALSQRLAAIVHTAMFDAYNGVKEKYTPIFYIEAADNHTNADAALIAASYTTLVALFPTRKPQLDASYAAATAALGGNATKIANGLAYGTTVANAVLAWRAADNFSTPLPAFNGGTVTGQWRPTPPAFAAMSVQSMAFTQNFIAGSAQYRPAKPRGLLTQTYTDDFNASKSLGRKTGSTRTPEQTALALFWEGNATVHWNQIAAQAAIAEGLSTSKSVRLFAVLNVAMADGAITAWSCKRFYGNDATAVTWRPVHSIPLADNDGNADTISDATWEPLIATPAHPEYCAGHPTQNGVGATVVLSTFADAQSLTLTTAGQPNQTYTSVAQARDDGNNARVWGGMHYPSTVAISDAMGENIANWVDAHVAREHGGGNDHDD